MIKIPYSLTKREKKILSSYFSDYNDWHKSIFDPVKENIKNHLRAQQNNKCCYCQKVLGFDIKEVDIEHVIPKSTISKFTFHCKNLALSCPACNTKKHDKNVFISVKNITNYPSTSKNIKIIHPHYDEYSENIEIKSGGIYIALTSKGSETITICELFRLKEVQRRENESKSKTSLAAELIENIRQGGNDIKSLLDLLNNELIKINAAHTSS